MSESAQDAGRSKLKVGSEEFEYYRISDLPGIDHLPYSLRILAENLLRHQNGTTVTRDQLDQLLNWNPKAQPDREIQFSPARVLMQDFTGVPCMVDLATMRDAVKALGDDPSLVNPLIPAQMVIDQSVQVDSSGVPGALEHNMDMEYQRNSERYRFLRWSQQAFQNFRVVPPGTGIIHQVNLEYLAQVVMRRDRTQGEGPALVYPDSCVGTDSHTTMVNGLGVLVLTQVARPLRSWRGLLVLFFAAAGVIGALIPMVAQFFAISLPTGPALAATVGFALVGALLMVLTVLGYPACARYIHQVTHRG